MRCKVQKTSKYFVALGVGFISSANKGICPIVPTLTRITYWSRFCHLDGILTELVPGPICQEKVFGRNKNPLTRLRAAQ